MASQYIPVPSGNVNFTEALTKSLFGLSKTLSDAADEEASQEQIKLDRADALARDAENKRRFDLQEARANEKFEQDSLLFRQTQDELKRAKADREILANITPEFSFEDMGPNVQDRYKAALASIENQKQNILDSTSTAYFDEKGMTAAGKQEYDNRFDKYLKATNDPLEASTLATADIQQADKDRIAYQKQALGVLDERLNILNTVKERLPAEMTKGEAATALRRQLKDAGYTDLYSDKANAYVDNILKERGFTRTKADILASAAASNEAIYKQEQDRINNLEKYYKLKNSSTKPSSGKGYQGPSSEDFISYINDLDFFGDGDKQKGIELLSKISTEAKNPKSILYGIDQGAIREAIMLTGSASLLSDNKTLDPEKPKELEKVGELARALSLGKTTGQEFIDKEKFTIKTPAALSLDELLGRRFDRLSNTLLRNVPSIPKRSIMKEPSIGKTTSKIIKDNFAKNAGTFLLNPSMYIEAERNSMNQGNGLPSTVSENINPRDLKDILNTPVLENFINRPGNNMYLSNNTLNPEFIKASEQQSRIDSYNDALSTIALLNKRISEDRQLPEVMQLPKVQANQQAKIDAIRKKMDVLRPLILQYR